MTLLFSASGLRSLIKALFHGLFIISGAVLLGYVFYKSGKARKIYLGIFLVVIGYYAYWLYADYQQRKEEDKQYIGKYNLTRYGDCSTCILELYPDNTFKIYNQANTYESGTWAYYNDGDISFVQFNNGGQLGYNKYEYTKK